MKVRDVMTTSVSLVAAENTIQDAAERMKTLDVGDLPVVTDNQIIGIVTDRDIVLRAVVLGLDPQKTPVSEAMTKGVVVCKEDDDLAIAARMMKSRRLRRLPVINHNRELTGILTISDLAGGVAPAEMVEIIRSISQ